MKVPEAVLKRFYNAFFPTVPSEKLAEQWKAESARALVAALEQLREELEGDEACHAAWEHRNDPVGPLGSCFKEKFRVQMRAALNSVLGDKEGQ